MQFVASGLKIAVSIGLPLVTSDTGKIWFLHLQGFLLNGQAESREMMLLFPVLQYTAAFLYYIMIRGQCYFLLSKHLHAGWIDCALFPVLVYYNSTKIIFRSTLYHRCGDCSISITLITAMILIFCTEIGILNVQEYIT